ncbi:Uncharacterised protein [Enterobacter hormaechei]|nr:Uncharacterised protein [Enterobacter hormaechei]
MFRIKGEGTLLRKSLKQVCLNDERYKESWVNCNLSIH